MKIIFLAWEYPGVNSIQGTALARRIGQLTIGLGQLHEIVVIHPNHKKETAKFIQETPNIKRIPIGYDIYEETKSSLIRKLETFFYMLTKGDRTSSWFNYIDDSVLKEFRNANLIVAFFTPRAPLYVANKLSKKYSIPWIADLQDPYFEGVENRILKLACKQWTSNLLKTAKAIVYVDPHWAKRDSYDLKRIITPIRHGVPDEVVNFAPAPPPVAEGLRLIYSGSLDPATQSPILFNSVVNQLINIPIELSLATNDSVLLHLNSFHWHKNFCIKHLGWLSKEKLHYNIAASHAILFLPWYSSSRIGIPSKFFEMMSWDKPILIAGPDAGSLKILLEEVGHKNVICDTPEKLNAAILKIAQNDYSDCFQIQNCTNQIFKESNLIMAYLNMINQIVAQ